MKPILAVLLALTAFAGAKEASSATAVVSEMADAANAFLKSLDEEQAKQACFPFEGDERDHWIFVPSERKGLAYKVMKPEQRVLARKLLESGMGEAGLVKIDTINALEKLLGELEQKPEYRDPERYFTTIFGDPSPTGTWGWRYEGHHTAVNFTIVNGKTISATPIFFGSNRAETTEGRLKGTRPLGKEEDLARVVAKSLKDAGKAVVYSEAPPKEILTSNERKIKQLDPVGVPASEMTDAQKEQLLALVSEYANRHRSYIAEVYIKKVKADMANVRFGWAGGLEKGQAYYYRVQGTDFLIEACNIQNDANHMHTVWRDCEGDFGRDALAEHMKADHAN